MALCKELLQACVRDGATVYVATDMDVAGTYLASRLPNFHRLSGPPGSTATAEAPGIGPLDSEAAGVDTSNGVSSKEYPMSTR
jgi:hypothetical protein